MKLIRWTIIAATFVRTGIAASPTVTPNGILNAASSARPGWPNSSIAQGSIFSVYGSSLGPSTSPPVTYPLQTTLAGVSIQIDSGQIILNAFPIFVSSTLVNAILPDNVPAGPATLIVTFNAQASNPVPFQVAVNSFGIFSVDANGAGPGVITSTNYELYPLNSPAKPGDVAVIWGTGIGPSPGDDGSAPPPQIDMPNLPLSVYVGNQPASVLYRGRTAFTGEDQINFLIPPGITGCYVPIAVQIGNIVSNFVTMPIAPSGQACPDPTPPVQPLGPNTPTNNPETGSVLLIRTILIGDTATTTDSVAAFFGSPQIDSFPYAPPTFGNPYSLPTETCIGGIGFPEFIDVLTTELPAGTINVAGPNGSQQVASSGINSGTYAVQIGGGSGTSAQPLFLSLGSYTVSATGGTFVAPDSGPGVGPFSQMITVPQPLNWTNQANVSSIDRSAGLEVTWSGGDPNGTVQITGDVGFICNAKASDQSFTIPSFVLLSIPPSGTSDTALTLGSVSTVPFTASGIASGAVGSLVLIRKTVAYQ